MFLFLFAMSEKKENTITEKLKFTGSIYRILKTQNTISFPKFAVAKQVDLINFSFCDKYNLTLYVNRTGHFPYFLTYHYPPADLHFQNI